MNRLGFYIHIPFCKKKCKYCDFISFFSSDEMIKMYFEKLIEEIDNINVGDRKLTTIYIGGGTPSFPDSKYIVKILSEIYKKFVIDEKAEITIEINPGTVTKEKLFDYKKSGINRVSIGLQSAEDRLLKLIGRIHTYDEFLNTYKMCREVGFENINIDLMLALPDQTEKELINTLDSIINLNPEHISLYSLILEDGTELQKMVEKNIVKLPEENIERDMYWKTKKILEKK